MRRLGRSPEVLKAGNVSADHCVEGKDRLVILIDLVTLGGKRVLTPGRRIGRVEEIKGGDSGR